MKLPIPTIEWKSGKVRFIDQTKLPTEFVIKETDDYKEIISALKTLQIRGAPAIGIAGAFGVMLGIQNLNCDKYDDFKSKLDKIIFEIGNSRPTAINLFWALDRMNTVAELNKTKSIARIKKILLTEALSILEEDKMLCRRIGEYGSKLIEDGFTILTHCNAGGLATSGYGTALAPIFVSHQEGKEIYVYASETRPLLQGARLTTWELMQVGIDVTLICDNMVGAVMREGKIDCVIVGADRIASNGDTANKIGTYNIAVLAKEHKIPFYVAAPSSTFDLNIKTGNQIPIEQRSPEEVTEGFGKRTAPENVKVYNPAFDVTPARLIDAIITDKGIIRSPYIQNIKKVMG